MEKESVIQPQPQAQQPQTQQPQQPQPQPAASDATRMEQLRSEEADESIAPPPGKIEPPAEEDGAKAARRRKDKDPKKKPEREYLGWKDANDIEWRRQMEWESYEKWKSKFGPGTEWMDRYEQWICSGMTRGAMRKPSYRAVEWVKYQRGIEIAPIGECCTRNKVGVKDFFVEPLENYCCRPCPWPKVTSGEIGWLGQHRSCQLEIYPNDYMKKPPLPWHHKKISSFLPGSM